MMKRQMLFYVILLCCGFLATASELIKPYPRQVLRNELIRYSPVANHHFSSEAPQQCGTGVLIERSPREIVCQFQQSGTTQATINVCDDKKTFCKPIELPIVVGAALSKQKAIASEKSQANKKASDELHKTLVPGFSEGSPDEVRAKVRLSKQPVFAMISTEWCPPCNETKEYIFSNPEFAKISKDWLKVYIDGDSLAVGEWETLIPYNAFPTMVMLDSELREIGRFNREIRFKEFADWSAEQAKHRDDPIVILKSRVLARLNNSFLRTVVDVFSGQKIKDEELWRLLGWAIDANDTNLISLLRDKMPKNIQPSEAMRIRLSAFDLNALSGEDKDKVKKEALLVDLVNWTSDKDDFSDYLYALCEINLEKCKTFTERMSQRVSAIKAWSGLTESESLSALAEESLMQHEIYTLMSDTKKAKDAALLCAELYGKQVKMSKLSTARSANQGRVHCLEMSGRTGEAESLVQELIKTYPHEPTFMLRMARLKRKQKQLESAHDWINRAARLAYGYNWYSAILFKADLELEMKQPKTALSTLDEALAQVDLPTEKDRRNHLLVQRIRGLQAKIGLNLKP